MKPSLRWGITVAPVPAAFFLEPYLPLGDWRWALLAAMVMAPGLWAHRSDIGSYLRLKGVHEQVPDGVKQLVRIIVAIFVLPWILGAGFAVFFGSLFLFFWVITGFDFEAAMIILNQVGTSRNN